MQKHKALQSTFAVEAQLRAVIFQIDFWIWPIARHTNEGDRGRSVCMGHNRVTSLPIPPPFGKAGSYSKPFIEPDLIPNGVNHERKILSRALKIDRTIGIVY